MSTDLVTIDYSTLPSTSLGTDEQFADISKSGDFLGRLQLFTKGKPIDKGLIRPGHYGIPESAEDIIDLGDSIDILPLARKPKAIDMSDKQAIQTSYDPASKLFQRIQATAQEKESMCMYGPAFLVFERSTGRLLELFCGSKSSRGEAKKLFPYLPLTPDDIVARGIENEEPHGPIPVTLKSRLVERQFSWHVPVVFPCSTPFTNLPSSATIVREITKFLTVKADEVEVVEEGRRGRAR